MSGGLFPKIGSFTLNTNMKVRYVKENENGKIFYEHGFQKKKIYANNRCFNDW